VSTDPTRTKTLRRDFEADAYKRFRSFKGDVRESVEEKDVLHLGQQQAVNDSPNPRDYQFLSNPEKREQFLQWLRQQIDEDILETTNSRDNIRSGRHWTSGYIRTAYSKGIEHADAELRKQGIEVPEEEIQNTFNKPIHSSKLEMLYLRTYDGLEGITQDMDTKISRTLTQAMSEGWNPRKAASKINEEVDHVGINRARTLARTEIINAHAEGTLNRLEEHGVEKVSADVEFSSADDSRVCPVCKSLDGGVYTIDEARGKIPRHPNCRCAWKPGVESSND